MLKNLAILGVLHNNYIVTITKSPNIILYGLFIAVFFFFIYFLYIITLKNIKWVSLILFSVLIYCFYEVYYDKHAVHYTCELILMTGGTIMQCAKQVQDTGWKLSIHKKRLPFIDSVLTPEEVLISYMQLGGAQISMSSLFDQRLFYREIPKIGFYDETVDYRGMQEIIRLVVGQGSHGNIYSLDCKDRFVNGIASFRTPWIFRLYYENPELFNPKSEGNSERGYEGLLKDFMMSLCRDFHSYDKNQLSNKQLYINTTKQEHPDTFYKWLNSYLSVDFKTTDCPSSWYGHGKHIIIIVPKNGYEYCNKILKEFHFKMSLWSQNMNLPQVDRENARISVGIIKTLQKWINHKVNISNQDFTQLMRDWFNLPEKFRPQIALPFDSVGNQEFTPFWETYQKEGISMMTELNESMKQETIEKKVQLMDSMHPEIKSILNGRSFSNESAHVKKCVSEELMNIATKLDFKCTRGYSDLPKTMVGPEFLQKCKDKVQEKGAINEIIRSWQEILP